MAEHRRQQRDALLAAARRLLADGGAPALTFPALAEHTGLARSSVYEYFRSRGAVVEALCATDFPLWVAEVEAAMGTADTPAEQLEAYIRRQLTLAGDARHRAVAALAASELDPGAREKIRAAHGGLVELVVAVLAELGHPDPPLAAALLQGVVDAAVRRTALGVESPEPVADEAVRLALHGLSHPVPAHRPADRPPVDRRPPGDAAPGREAPSRDVPAGRSPDGRAGARDEARGTAAEG